MMQQSKIRTFTSGGAPSRIESIKRSLAIVLVSPLLAVESRRKVFIPSVRYLAAPLHPIDEYPITPVPVVF
jgi:hypothetical protein